MIFWLLHLSQIKRDVQTANSVTVLLIFRRIDGQLLSLWDGSETYFVRSIARLALLNVSLQNPSKDLGPPALDRCRGFAIHLMVNDTCVMYCMSIIKHMCVRTYQL
jgi:hypothetical protein